MTPRAWAKSAFLVITCLAVVVSCATSRGTTLSTVMSTEKAATAQQTKPPETPAQSPPQSQKGLEIVTDPSSAEVWIDGVLKGLSPIVLTDIVTGWHRVVLRKTGYHETSAWVDFNSDYMFYQASLVRITGFLQLSVLPQSAVATVDGSAIPTGLVQLGVGTYTLTVRLFGYTDYSAAVTIQDSAITTVAVSLSPAPFAVTSFVVPKPAVNPENPGFLGTIDCRFSVTAPGSGEMRVADSAGAVVYSKPLPDFTTWDQAFSWDVRDAAGVALPDGAYTLRLVAHGADSTEEQVQEAKLTVDRTLKIAPRSVWSGSAGLLYAPTAEVLPAGDFQISVLGAGIAVSDGFQAPVQLGARIGLGSRFEIDASAGLIASSVALPFTASVAARWNMSSPHGDYGTSSALQAKLAVQLVPGVDIATPLMTDTFANFTGVSVEVPLQLSLDRVSFLLTVGATGSLWYPYRLQADGTGVQSAVAWLYLRAGALVDLGPVTAGISASTRTEPLPGGVAFLSSPVPFEAGAEIHWLIPGTSLLLSGIIAGEYENGNNYYFMGGGGLGFLY
jgi:hypothetical protein